MAFIVVIVLLLLWGVAVYNKLVGLRNRAAGAWADIDVQLKRRHNLVANLVETVKGYAQHERSTLEEVVRARNQAESARGGGSVRETGVAESLLGQQIRSLFALAEAYPDLKANEGFRDLQASLEKLEADIQNARRYYNAVVRDFNTRIQSVPDTFIARTFGFKERDFFELEDAAERAVPKVDFGTGS
ncbi:MAG: LemA family protein [Candidatus Latescibacterota bacterium]|nr:MAG: LemA family protein [Candidatus Latescibacterota bacterium]